MDYCAIYGLFDEWLLRGLGENPSPSDEDFEDFHRNYAAGSAISVYKWFGTSPPSLIPERFLFM